MVFCFNGRDHPDYALSLNNLGMLYRALGRYVEAEPLLDHALAIYQRAFCVKHPDLSSSLTNLALLYRATGRSAQALALMGRLRLTIDDRLIGQVFPISSQRQRAALLENIRIGTDLFLSMAASPADGSTGDVCLALDWVLRRKAVGVEVERIQRVSVLGGKYPHLESALRKLDLLAGKIDT